MLDGGPVLNVIVVERLKRILEEAVVVLDDIDGRGVQIGVVLLHPMHLLQITLNHLVLRAVDDLRLLLRRHLHPHGLLIAETAIGVLLLEDVPVDAAAYDELS